MAMKYLSFEDTIRICDLFGSDNQEQDEEARIRFRGMARFAVVCEDCGEVMFMTEEICNALAQIDNESNTYEVCEWNEEHAPVCIHCGE